MTSISYSKRGGRDGGDDLTLTEFFAGYSAIVATAVAVWNVYARFNDGPRLRATAHPNMKIMGGAVRDSQTYIAINAMNIGNRATTIVTVGMYQFDSRWKRLRRRSKRAWIINTVPPGNVTPHVLEPGHRFMTLAPQNEEIIKATNEKLVYVAIGESMGKRKCWFGFALSS